MIFIFLFSLSAWTKAEVGLEDDGRGRGTCRDRMGNRSSNVSRFYGNPAPKGYREYQLVKCTDFNSFKSQLTDVKPNIKCVVISVIENFLADKVGKETGLYLFLKFSPN